MSAISSVPVKSPEAVAELASRQRKLSQRHRTVLLLVDGRRTEQAVRLMARQAGAPDVCFDELVGLGMITLPAEAATTAAVPFDADPAPAPRPLTGWELPAGSGPDSVASLLPASLTLQPESSLNDSSLNESILNEPPSSDLHDFDDLARDGGDVQFQEARDLMIRAVRAEAPVAGSLTLLRLRRARSREELGELADEVELRITKPFKGLWAAQTMSRVRELLTSQSVT